MRDRKAQPKVYMVSETCCSHAYMQEREWVRCQKGFDWTSVLTNSVVTCDVTREGGSVLPALEAVSHAIRARNLFGVHRFGLDCQAIDI